MVRCIPAWCSVPADVSPLPPSVEGTVVTVGTFDGLHRGHRFVLDRVAGRARELGLAGVLVTFEPHPLTVVRPEATPPLLTLPDERAELLATTGIDYVIVVPFTAALAALTAEQFIDTVLRTRLRMEALLVGHDHRFGKGRDGDVTALQEIGRRRGFDVEAVPAVEGAGGRPVSSSAIRAAVGRGDLAAAAAGLGRRYGVAGRVVPGAQRGRALGFPTINVSPPARKLLPAYGVYAVQVSTRRGTFGGMLNHGPRPTFDDLTVTLEAHLFDVEADLYETHVRLEFVARLRDVQRFDTPAALAAQLAVDERAARDALRALTQTL